MGGINSRLSRLEGRAAQRIRLSAPKLCDELEDYFAALDNYQREKSGLPPIHYIEEGRDPDPELEAYFLRLEEQEEERRQILEEGE